MEPEMGPDIGRIWVFVISQNPGNHFKWVPNFQGGAYSEKTKAAGKLKAQQRGTGEQNCFFTKIHDFQVLGQKVDKGSRASEAKICH